MMRGRVSVLALGLLLGLGGLSQAGPVWISNAFVDDNAYRAAYGEPPGPAGTALKNEAFAGEGRWGNNSSNPGQYEYNINRLNSPGTSGSNFQFGYKTGNLVWPNGTPQDFELEYAGDNANPALQTLRWTVGTNPILSGHAVFGGVKDLVLRTRSANATNATTLSDLTLIDLTTMTSYAAPPGFGVSSTGSGAVNYGLITGFDFSKPWKLKGKVTVSWTAAPLGSASMNWQIKAMRVTAVPEPSTLTLSALPLLGGFWLARRRLGLGRR